MHKTLFTLLFCAALSANAIEPLPVETMDDTRVFRVEVLQVTEIEPYREALTGFLTSLQANGLVEGKNLRVHKATIDFDAENGGFWSRLGVLLRIRQESARIVEAKPDLVLTIGTPATKYARGMMTDARIPLVFTAVANPEDAGCVSLVDAGEGATGATLYTDMSDTLKLIRDVFPEVRRIGMVHSDDDNGIANVAAASAKGKPLGLDVSARQVHKNEPIAPKLKALYAAGAEMFAVPLDTYYGLHRYEAAMDLGDFGVDGAGRSVPAGGAQRRPARPLGRAQKRGRQRLLANRALQMKLLYWVRHRLGRDPPCGAGNLLPASPFPPCSAGRPVPAQQRLSSWPAWSPVRMVLLPTGCA